jgi:hypothetical protein
MAISDSQSVERHFSAEESAQIREAVAADRTPLMCPRCDRVLTSRLRGGRCSHHDIWVLHCDTCLARLVVEDA